MSCSYHTESKTFIKVSCTDNAHWRKRFLQLPLLKVVSRFFSEKVKKKKKRVPYFDLFETFFAFLEVRKLNEYWLWVVRGKFIFLYADIWFDATKCKFIVKNSSLKCCLRFCLFLWWTQK